MALVVKAVETQGGKRSVESSGHEPGVPQSFEPSQSRLRFLMVGGGTGGHIFPVLAVAEELRARGARLEHSGTKYLIEFLGTKRPLEARLIPGAGFPLRTINAAGLKGMSGFRSLRNLMLLPRTAVATARCCAIFSPRWWSVSAGIWQAL